LVAGRVYKFRYKARNIFGLGEWSDEASILAASVPDIIEAVETSLHGLMVKISWVSTTPENGSAITAYEVKIKTSEDVYVTDDICDGSEPVTFGQTYCLIPMEHFI